MVCLAELRQFITNEGDEGKTDRIYSPGKLCYDRRRLVHGVDRDRSMVVTPHDFHVTFMVVVSALVNTTAIGRGRVPF